MAVKELDQAKVEQFSGKMLDTLNAAGLALMTSIGHRTRLFDTMAEMEPADVGEIATRAGLNERYVREWLGAMTVSGVTGHDPESNTYWLPAEHAACLTRAASPNNLAAYQQYAAVLGSVENDIVDCFIRGGGVPYSKFKRFQEVMADDSGQTVLPALTSMILPLAPEVLPRLEQGIDVLEVGCGLGRALNLLARTFPNSRFLGYEISEEAVAKGNEDARAHGSTNIEFKIQDAATFTHPDEFDLLLTFDAIHDQADPATVLRNIYASLRAGGVYIMQDIKAHTHVHGNIGHPMGTFIYTVSCMHCMTVSLACGGAGLGAAWGRQLAEKMLRDAGFDNVEINELDHDPQNYFYVMRKRA